MGPIVKNRRITFLLLILALYGSFCLSSAGAAEKSPQWWSAELKMGFWMPTNNTTKQFFDKCCNINVMLDGGFLYKGRYGVEVGAGFMIKDGNAVGVTTGSTSSDKFDLLTIPMETNAVIRFDFVENQIVVPYVKGGADYVYYREDVKGIVTSGLKTGLHAQGGLQFLVEAIDTDATLETDFGINDIYFVIDAKYSWINSFGKTGLDLSGMTYSAGILFEF